MIQFRDFTPDDYEQVITLWRASGGVVLREADERAAIELYLARNPGLSFVACDGPRVIGAVLCGSDGRRGYLQHLAVAPTHQRQGIGRDLAQRAVAALAAGGIAKCHLMVVSANAAARAFWRHLDWTERTDVVLMSHVEAGSADS